jgi:hypothetical protein
MDLMTGPTDPSGAEAEAHLRRRKNLFFGLFVVGVIGIDGKVKALIPGSVRDGGAEGVRTPDLLNAIQALYQLSYDPRRSDEDSKAFVVIVKMKFGKSRNPTNPTRRKEFGSRVGCERECVGW